MNYCGRVVLTLVLTWNWVPTAVGAEGPGAVQSQAQVYIFRGFVGYWPDAFGMAARMSSRGYRPQIYRKYEVPRVTSEVVNNVDQGERGPIYLIGYSYGGSAAVALARDLMEHGITVDRMVLIEAYDYPQIPANVRYCVNLYESRRMDRVQPFRGTPAQAADSSSTELIDIDLAVTPGWEDVRKNNHFNMADDPQIQDFVAQQFPDVTLPLPSDQWVGRAETIALPPSRVLSGAAPLPQAFGPAYESANSTYYLRRPEQSGAAAGSPYMSYRGLQKSNSFNIANDPQVQRSPGLPIPNMTREYATQMRAVEPEATIRPSHRPPTGILTTPQALSSSYGSSNPTLRTVSPQSFGLPRGGAYSSYRAPVPR